MSEIYFIVIINIVLFICGYLLGKHNNQHFKTTNKPKSFLNDKSLKQTDAVDIDETKIVTKINTDSLEKKYTDLGQTTATENNIGDSIKKLKNLKK